MSNEAQSGKRSRILPRLRVLAPLCVLALALVAVGCGGNDSSPNAQSTAASGSDTSQAPATDSGGATAGDAVTIVDFDYDPKTITVDAGGQVEFTNEDSAAHTATADDSSFDTGTLKQGDTAKVTLDKPGTYTYYCRFHAFMKASIEVR